MIRLILLVSLSASGLSVAAEEATPVACVLDGPEVQPMRDALKRLAIPFRDHKTLDPSALARCRVLVLCGAGPPVAEADKQTLVGFLDAGGAVLGAGGGATCVIDLGLFDAEAYYLTGTTIHMSSFQAYHRLTFGYPGAKPFDGWVAGVPNLLRSTEGPLMTLGPGATCILSTGGGYSLAAFQGRGQGLVLLLSADPQGGKIVHQLGRSKMAPGDELQTDRLLANAMAFLLDRTCNLIPNSGFEENMHLQPRQSNWTISLAKGATSDCCQEGAPEGAAFLMTSCPTKASSASIGPYRPIAVERGTTYVFAGRYRASVAWRGTCEVVTGKSSKSDQPPAQTSTVAPSRDWARFEVSVSVPADGLYVKPLAAIRGPGELCLDEVTLRRQAGQ